MKVHIDFLRDQLSALEREATNLKTQVTQLQTANDSLRDQCQQRAAEIQRLKATETGQEEQKPQACDEKEVAVLKMLLNGNKPTFDEIARQVAGTNDKAQAIVRRLEQKGFVCVRRGGGYVGGRMLSATVILTHDGRAYLDSIGEL